MLPNPCQIFTIVVLTWGKHLNGEGIAPCSTTTDTGTACLHSKITMAASALPYYTDTALVPTQK